VNAHDADAVQVIRGIDDVFCVEFEDQSVTRHHYNDTTGFFSKTFDMEYHNAPDGAFEL